MAQLKSYYRLCFAYGPFICSPGPGMIAVYIDHSHFRRWLCWSPEHAKLDLTTTVKHINGQLKKAMDEDDAAGGMGRALGTQSGGKVGCGFAVRAAEAS